MTALRLAGYALLLVQVTAPALWTGCSAAAARQDEADGSARKRTTTIVVHYPAGAHTVSVRGSQGPLSWSGGQVMTPGAQDSWTFTTSALAAPAEWKPLLDDVTWALGPNYHVSPGTTVEVYPHFTSPQGQVVTLFASFHSTTLGNDRAIYAYLPASYAENQRATYPVLYMHDGQNLWAALPKLAFASTWNVDTTSDAAAATGACSSDSAIGWAAQPFGGPALTCNGDGDCAAGSCRTFPEAIVIGVANTAGRIYEYTPTVDPTQLALGPAGGGDLYLQFLVTELKPQVDAMLRTQPGRSGTLMLGSSLGGLISAYAGCTQAETWGRIGAMSPSTWWDNEVIISDVGATAGMTPHPDLVYVDSGTDGAEDDLDGYMETDMLAAQYLAIGYVEGQTFHHVVQQGGQHSEVYWAQRLPGALQFLLGPRD